MAINTYFDPKTARGSVEVPKGAVSIYGRGLHFSAFHYNSSDVLQAPNFQSHNSDRDSQVASLACASQECMHKQTDCALCKKTFQHTHIRSLFIDKH